MFNLTGELKTDILTILAKRFELDIQIGQVTQLTQGRRNLVLRIALEPSLNPNLPNSLILKQSLIQEGADDQQLFGRFARDWAGLEFASQLPDDKRITPQFYGASLKHHFVLQQDFGHDHQSLVEPLTSPDREAAMTALRLYMQRMAQFHANGFNRTEEYKANLRSINPNAKAWQEDLVTLFSATENNPSTISGDFLWLSGRFISG